MNYDVTIPTLEEIRSIQAAASRKIQCRVLENIAEEMRECAQRNLTNCAIDFSLMAITNIDAEIMINISNCLREAGYMTRHCCKEEKLIIFWDDKSVAELQNMKDSGVQWRVTAK